jgi:hypothetical protein
MRTPIVAILLMVTGCPDRTISKVDPTQNGALTKDIPQSADIDLLFVIDNSRSTLEKQTVFAANFTNFVTALKAFPGVGLPNLHIGVVTTSVDIGVVTFAGCPSPNTTDDGRLQNTARTPGCPAPSDRYIVDVATGATRLQNYPGGDLAAALSCIAQVGDGGCGFEAPLNAMKRALDSSRPENAGFVRDGAFLAVVILTDEDDCSTKDGAAGSALFSLNAATVGPDDFRCQPQFAYNCDTPISPTAAATYTNCKVRTDSYLQDPDAYADFLGTIKDPNQLVVALIAGDPETTIMTGPLTQGGVTQTLALQPSCTATIGGATALGRPGIRLNQFVANFGDHGLFSSVCQPDYTDALAKVGELLFKEVSPCLDGKLDVADSDPNNPGTQLDCTVSDVQNLNTTTQTSTLIPACRMTAEGVEDPSSPKPCWYTQSDAAMCTGPTETGLKIVFDRNNQAPPIGTTTQVACATTPQN